MGYPTDRDFEEAHRHPTPPRPPPRPPPNAPWEIRERVREEVADTLFRIVPGIDPHDDEAWIVDKMMEAFDTALVGHVILKT